MYERKNNETIEHDRTLTLIQILFVKQNRQSNKVLVLKNILF